MKKKVDFPHNKITSYQTLLLEAESCCSLPMLMGGAGKKVRSAGACWQERWLVTPLACWGSGWPGRVGEVRFDQFHAEQQPEQQCAGCRNKASWHQHDFCFCHNSVNSVACHTNKSKCWRACAQMLIFIVIQCTLVIFLYRFSFPIECLNKYESNGLMVKPLVILAF